MRLELLDLLPGLAGTAVVVAAVLAAGHAVLYRRDPRAALAWVGLIALVPLLGVVLYYTFGINRIRRRAQALRPPVAERNDTGAAHVAEAERVRAATEAPQLVSLARLVHSVVQQPLTGGNRVTLLENGDEAYPAMLRVIEHAEHSVALSSYIFAADRSGNRFVRALAAAVERGVRVRVLVDAIGERYTRPTITGVLRRAGVTCARFHPTWFPWRFAYLNLRNHRKLLVVDGRVGFTGGMNISVANEHRLQPHHMVQDVHARVAGPVVHQLLQVFAEDWLASTGETLEGKPWFSEPGERGPVLAREIPDGPDEDLDELRLCLLGALGVARERVRIVTPYFLPDAALITALNVAALRGVTVDIVLPARGNLRLVEWATRAQLWQVLERGCRVWLTPPPFDHTKLVTVDSAWTLLGSANWDPRSLRLNFESNLECYDRELAAAAAALIEARIARARQLTLAEADARSLPIRLRDGVARLFHPIL